MFETILVPLDGSACAEAALAVAELIPSQRIRLLNVRSDLIQLDEIRESARDGEAYLERIAESLRSQGRTVSTDVVFGDARRQIVAFAALSDLVVMGSRGCGATENFFLGSVADWVARHAPAPTLIVRGGEHPARTSPLTRVLIPLDGSSLAEEALPTASLLAGDLGLPLHLVRVLDFDPVRASVEAGMAAAEASASRNAEDTRLAEEYLDEQVQQLRNQDLVATREVRSGPPAAELLAAIQAGDLVVLTTRKRGGLARWLLGSMADELIRRAPGPILVVRATAAGLPQPRPNGSDAAPTGGGSASLSGSAS